ncbi:hypothetical protein E5S67_03311 [Microcoleus sp. IPMA8]|uniref:Transposase n=2 Tax=Microcoleus TaxID=44471 RepID=A0ABX2CYU9_9CYAN|nr:hypothetical protein [Microcoleus asticus IPMA8]
MIRDIPRCSPKVNGKPQAVNSAANMTWKGLKPIVHLLETTYEKGIKVPSQELKKYLRFCHRSSILPKWDIAIVPT